MVLYSEDYQFLQNVSFVRLDEYYNEPGAAQLRNRFHQVPQSRQSFLHFNESGQLLSCRSQAEQSEQLHCHYENENGLLIGRVFTTQNGNVYRENRIYNEQKLLVEKNFLDNGTLKKRICYKYNEEFQLIREEDLKNIKRYFYNDAGLCLEKKLYTGNEHIKSLLYYYDDNGNVAEIWEEKPFGQNCRLHKYYYNQYQLISNYQLVSQDGLILKNLEYKYSNFIENDWLERYTWRLSGRSGKLSYHPVHSCLRSPCLEVDSNLEAHFQRDFKTLELSEGTYHGQTRLGMMHGQGRLDFFDGSYYIGHFEAGHLEGYGSFYWPDGRVYQGHFENNKMQGLGNYYLADGSLYRGTFAEGQLLSSNSYYYLAGTSPLSRQNRSAAQAANRQNRQNRAGARESIEAATKAVQQTWIGPEPAGKDEAKPLLKQEVISANSVTPVVQTHTLSLFEDEQGAGNFTGDFEKASVKNLSGDQQSAEKDFHPYMGEKGWEGLGEGGLLSLTPSGSVGVENQGLEPALGQETYFAEKRALPFRGFSEENYRDLLLAKQQDKQLSCYPQPLQERKQFPQRR